MLFVSQVLSQLLFPLVDRQAQIRPREKRSFSLPSLGIEVLSIVAVLDQLHGVAFPEEQGLDERPGLAVSPMFAEDVCRVAGAADVVELGDTRCDAFSDSMEGEGIMAFVQLGIGKG